MIVSPDEGSIKRAVGHCKRLGGTLAIIDKRRQSAFSTAQENLIGGPVDGKVCLMFDDMVSTAGSICGAAKLLKSQWCAPDSRRRDTRCVRRSSHRKTEIQPD